MTTEPALVVVGHGTVSDTSDVPEFLRRIRRGRPATPDFVHEIQRRYRVIGRLPLLEVTESLARALETRLGLTVRVAMRFWTPLIEDVVSGFVRDGVRKLCILPVAPFSVHVYANVVREALATVAQGGRAVPEAVAVEPYGSDASLVRAQASKIASHLRAKSKSETELVFTAHSLPVHVIAAGDPYQEQFEASARAIAHELGWAARVAYQSQGADGGEWLGPTLDDALRGAHDGGKKDVVVAPVGFLADHVETLYDLDVEAAAHARDLGLGFVRVPTLGNDAALVDALAAIATRALA